MELSSLLIALFVKPALVIAAAAAIAAALQRHTAAARHAVWTGAILATLAVPALALVLPPLRIPLFRNGSAQPPTDAIAVPYSASVGAGDGFSTGSVRPGVAWSVSLGDKTDEDGLLVALIAIWISGVLVLGTRRAGAELRMHRLVQRGRPPSDPGIARRFAVECDALGLRRRPSLMVIDEFPVPAAAGLLRPVVLLPAAAECWSDTDLRAALLHELGHIRRHDGLLNLLADIAATAYWCNPLMWFAQKRMQSESERACDDLVLRGGVAPEGYAQLLLEVARTAMRSGGVPAVATTMARPRQIESRLRAVLDAEVARRPLRRWLTVSFAGLGVLLALPAAALTLHTVPGHQELMLPEPDPQGKPMLSERDRQGEPMVSELDRQADPILPEPDRQGDSLALPDSERLPYAVNGYDVPSGARAALLGPDSALTARLIDALDRVPRGREDLVRERAAWALAQARNGRLIEPLIEHLTASDWRVQAYAAWALATARDPRAVPPLVELLRHRVWRARAMAAYALREAGDRRAIGPMTPALADPAWQVRSEAVGYFVALGGPEMSNLVHPLLKDRHIAVRLAAAGLLFH